MLCAVSLGNPRLKGGIALILVASREYRDEAFGAIAVRRYNFSGASFGMNFWSPDPLRSVSKPVFVLRVGQACVVIPNIGKETGSIIKEGFYIAVVESTLVCQLAPVAMAGVMKRNDHVENILCFR
jgi:hypothetical protein